MSNQITDELLAILAKQQELLQKQAEALDKLVLGFHSNVGTRTIHCSRYHEGNWYYVDRGNPIPISESVLTGYIKQIRFEKVTRRGKPTNKLMVTVRADCIYVLETGYDTQFSKSFLKSIAFLSPQQLRQPITIRPLPGDDEAVLFCQVWVGNEQVFVPHDDNIDWRAIARRAIDNVKSAWGQEND